MDFTNPNLLGASPELNSVLEKLDAAKAEILGAMDSLASEASSTFGAAQNELTGLIDKLQTVEIPTLPKLNLQAEITNFASLVPGSPSAIQALAKIKTEFGGDLTTRGLGLDSLVKEASAAILGGSSISSLVPNLEKEAGSILAATENPAAVKQAVDLAVTETSSTVWQNPDVAARVEENEKKTAEYVVTDKVPTKDTGAFKVVSDPDVKTISTVSGSTVKSVPAGTGDNVSPDAGFQHKKSTINEKVKFEDIMDEGGGRITILTKYSPVEVLLIQLHPSANYDNLITSSAEEKAALAAADSAYARSKGGPHYANNDGPHMEYVLHYSLRRRGISNVIVTIDPDVGISFTPPFKTVGDHPGNIESVPSERWNGKTWVQRPGTFRAPTGGLRSDKKRNKKYGGFAAVVRYTYLDNWDADIKTTTA